MWWSGCIKLLGMYVLGHQQMWNKRRLAAKDLSFRVIYGLKNSELLVFFK